MPWRSTRVSSSPLVCTPLMRLAIPAPWASARARVAETSPAGIWPPTRTVAPRLTQSAWFRPHNKDPKIPGLFIVGAGTHPGAGLPGVINSAKATVGLMLGPGALEPAA